jgi:DNA (cytosine-5)-methyltransferase 1
MLKYGSVCSGVEAATTAWHPLGWEPQWFSEIEKFPSAVLAHHYPDVPNLGDMTKFKEWPIDRSIDVLVGGTPCQSFSVAGLRKGLDDPRGNLMLTYLAIAAKYQPKWLVWENVPGVLSSNGGLDFASLLRGMGELGYGFAYRIFDAQYFGVAQRRKRVFVVGYAGGWQRAAAVLFERESMSRNPAPSREAGERVTGYTAASFGKYSEGVGTIRAAGGDLGGGSETLCVSQPIAYDTTNITSPTNGSNPKPGDPVFTLASGQHPPLLTPAVAIQNATRGASQNGLGITTDGPMYTLDVGSQHAVVTQTDGNPPAVAIQNATRGASGFKWHQGSSAGSIGYQLEQSPTLDTSSPPAVAYDTTNITSMQVRRLTPTECERLQGFSDNFTQIPWRNKAAEDCPDGPRYKAMGNSMAVPVMRWIGERIQKVEDIVDA